MIQIADSDHERIQRELGHALETLHEVQDNVERHLELMDFFLDATALLRQVPLDDHFDTGYAVGLFCGIAVVLDQKIEELLKLANGERIPRPVRNGSRIQPGDYQAGARGVSGGNDTPPSR